MNLQIIRVDKPTSERTIIETRNQLQSFPSLNVVLIVNFQMPVPSSCLPHYSDNDVPVGFISDSGDTEVGTVCFHGGRYHEEGAQWRSSVEPCVLCHCGGGRVTCDTLLCPPPPPGCVTLHVNSHTCCQHSCKSRSNQVWSFKLICRAICE